MRTQVLTLVLLSTMAIHCDKPKSTDATAKDTTAVDEISEAGESKADSASATEAYGLRRRVAIDKYAGKFVKTDSAMKGLNLYKKHMASNNPNYDPKNDEYGFVFGLENVRKLISKIDSINKKLKVDSLTGIRVYLSRKQIKGSKKTSLDVFLIPVGRNGRNIYSVDSDYHFIEKKKNIAAKSLESEEEEDLLILNTSVPCPNRCY